MIIYRNLFFGLLSMLVAHTATAQNLRIGATANIGLSKISSDIPYISDYKVKFSISGNAGLFAEYKISPKSSVGAELLWLQMEGHESNTQNNISIFDMNGNIIEGNMLSTAKLHLSYLALPLYYRFAIGKLGIKAGVQPMLCLFNVANFESKGTINGEAFESKDKTTDFHVDKIDIGPKVGIDYQFNNKISVRADYYYGLIDITESGDDFHKKNQQINIGLSYAFLSK